ncbi:MAG: hypothetical protein BMS9Abin13_162 [Patescibacteria group bacterium]|nr:MAG: hypothetical protein BMS9Abin13_162 [Patescibacteria group bacterium]
MSILDTFKTRRRPKSSDKKERKKDARKKDVKDVAKVSAVQKGVAAGKKKKPSAPPASIKDAVPARASAGASKRKRSYGGGLEYVFARPHITEKASMLAEKNVYVFEIDKRAGKAEVKSAVREIYNVEPRKVNIVNIPSKNVLSRGIKGVKSGKKKAMVYLKKGDSIEVM